jgi:hypothetical protein
MEENRVDKGTDTDAVQRLRPPSHLAQADWDEVCQEKEPGLSFWVSFRPAGTFCPNHGVCARRMHGLSSLNSPLFAMLRDGVQCKRRRCTMT